MYNQMQSYSCPNQNKITMTRITLEHVTKRYLPEIGYNGPSVLAVDDVSLKMNDGDVLAIVGPSGCGKSTLLRIIAGLIPPDSGRVLHNNMLLEDIPLQDRGIGMVFQEGALIPHWEARRSVGFFMELRKRQEEVTPRVRKIASITGIGLEKLLARRPRHLSGGEKQRVAVARALTRDMNVLLFDEPFANLDARIRSTARVELKRLLNEFTVTSVYVTHDQSEAIALSHRIAVMRNGHFEQVGTFQQLYDSPVNMFVSQFIGTPSINLFEGTVQDGKWYGEEFGGYTTRSDLDNGTKVTLGIRPQHMYLKDDGGAGLVEQVTPFLAENYQLVQVRLGKERWSITVPFNRRVEVGSTIYMGLDDTQALYFDTATGQRIG